MCVDGVGGSGGDGDWFGEVLSSESDSEDDDQGLALVEFSPQLEYDSKNLDPYPSWIGFWFLKRWIRMP